MCEEKSKPSLKAIFSNWNRSNASFLEKIKMLLKNNLRKIKNGETCCGNQGQVGC